MHTYACTKQVKCLGSLFSHNQFLETSDMNRNQKPGAYLSHSKKTIQKSEQTMAFTLVYQPTKHLSMVIEANPKFMEMPSGPQQEESSQIGASYHFTKHHIFCIAYII